MPRPPKHVSPGTLGGRIRAARERLQLSLADVAEGHYSTSLISQIERNRADPSSESLRFLAERLQLPFEDLETLAQQHRAAESEPRDCKTYEELRVEAIQLLNDKKFYDTLTLLNTIPLSQAPAQLRWRLAALRGHAYFEQRKFMKAQQDFLYAVDEDIDAESLPVDQQQELLLLHLHLAETHRALQQNDEAKDEYAIALQMINSETPAGYAAEANWGMSLVIMEANKKYTTSDASTKCWDLRKAL
ncbi:MAG TPA: helix-turn-helix transcriptional regulator, partial [Ktedonobacteraceae bacterium]|nr:helix-turn-helix transcriptional regulator [Ktedonobacteraceae bacterium]